MTPPSARTISRRAALAGTCAAALPAMLARGAQPTTAPATAPSTYPSTRPTTRAATRAAKFADADAAIEQAIEEGQSPGAVLCVGRKGGVEYLRAYGNRALQPQPVTMTVDTLFDLASLSKPIGCATSVMALVEQGKFAVTDRVAKYLPPFGANGKADVTIEQLLLHRGGLIADNPIEDFKGTPAEMMKRTLESALKYEPGTKVVYSDVGFITLGELARVTAGRPLNEFARDTFFKPLGMQETTYLPPDALKARCAPTEKRDGRWMVGEVHDPRAYALGGFAGHAGLFSTAMDVSRYCRMILGFGQLEGVRVLKESTVADMIRPRTLPDGTMARGYGFDIDTKYSAPRGERFPVGKSFGHTGFTGTSLWMDPGGDAFVILLTNAVHPVNKGKPINDLRRQVGTAVANAMLPPAPTTSTAPSQGAKPQAAGAVGQ
jgi:CubicO group peptidase (beta-lactamase class C family)